jgi:hypothetical protein
MTAATSPRHPGAEMERVPTSNDPTPGEIAAQCAKIQGEWSKSQRRKRDVSRPGRLMLRPHKWHGARECR